jgi:hypothetical protein
VSGVCRVYSSESRKGRKARIHGIENWSPLQCVGRNSGCEVRRLEYKWHWRTTAELKSATCIQGSAAALERPASRAKVVLELAIEEANLGHQSADTGHLLIGLLREQEGGAGRIRGDRGIVPEVVRTRINEFSSSSQKLIDIPRITSFE